MKQWIASISVIIAAVGLCSAQGITFGLVADPQYAPDTANQYRFYSTSRIRLQDAVDTFQVHALPFIAILGDHINGYEPTDTQKAYRDIDSLNFQLMRYFGDRYSVIGNHDCQSTSKEEFMGRIACIIPSKYYSFDRDNYHFVVLDCQYNPDGTDFNHNNNNWFNATIPDTEKQWLINDLAAAGKTSVFIFMHDCCDTTKCLELLVNAAEMRTIFENAGNVKAVFNGHKNAGGYANIHGIHYLPMKGMVEQALPSNAFAEVTVTPDDDSLIVKGYSNQTSYNLKLKKTRIGMPLLAAPANATHIQSQTPQLNWKSVQGTKAYHVQISTDSTFDTTIVDDTTLCVDTTSIISIPDDGTYYWRVNAIDSSGTTSVWSEVRWFKITTSITTNIVQKPVVAEKLERFGVLEVYMTNGKRVMELTCGTTATKTQLLNVASKTLAKGYYTYRLRGSHTHRDIVGKLVKK